MRIIEINNIGDAAREMSAIGVDPAGIKLMSGKAVFRAIKVYALRPVAANILKQEALSFGAEVATAYGSIDHSVKTTEVIVCGTIRQLLALAKKLKAHQFGLPGVGSGIEALLAKTGAVSRSLEIGKKSWHFGRRTYIMGIVNVTPDSFSDGGNFYSPEAAAERALKFKTCSYRSMKAILTAGLDRKQDGRESSAQISLPLHQNIRGREYYQ